MRRGKRAVFFIVVAMIFLLGGISFFGVSNTYGDLTRVYIKGAGDIPLGLDIGGGIQVTFRPLDGVDATEAELQSARAILERRLEVLGILDGEVYADLQEDRLIVRFPYPAGDELEPETMIEQLAQTGLLTFREGALMDENGRPMGTTKDSVILTGKDIAHAAAQPSQREVGQYEVQLELSEEGAAKYAEVTERLAGKDTAISIWMDETFLCARKEEGQISNGYATITGRMDKQTAEKLAAQINAGSFPFRLQTENPVTLSPTLGAEVKEVLLKAGVMAFAGMAAFLLIRYRLPGMVTVLSMFGQISLLVAAISGFFPQIPSLTLTLSAVGGIVLCLGMAAESGISIGERIREEIQTGKSLDGAVDSALRKSRVYLFQSYALLMGVGAVLMILFGSTNSLFSAVSASFAQWFDPITVRMMYIFGYVIFAGAAFGWIMFTAAYWLMIKSLCKMRSLRHAFLFGGDRV